MAPAERTSARGSLGCTLQFPAQALPPTYHAMALQLPWQRVSAFLYTDELLTIQTACSAFDVGELGGEYGPLLSFLLSAHVTRRGCPHT